MSVSDVILCLDVLSVGASEASWRSEREFVRESARE